MAEPPVTVLTDKNGAAAYCHLCEWQVVVGHSPLAPAGLKVSAMWASHWARHQALDNARPSDIEPNTSTYNTSGQSFGSTSTQPEQEGNRG